MGLQTRLTSLIKELEPTRTLFTTFTLRLSWFESFCMPVLKLGGCERIDLLVDSREACKTLNETTSIYAGNAYRVISVQMEKAGVFHPKIAYLQRESNDDVLVVGSGNLTFQGQGGNLEVIDAVNAASHPHVFKEFAEFVQKFLERPGLSEETQEALNYYAQRARYAASRANAAMWDAPRTTWLIHTLTDTAGDQLALLASDLDRAHRLTVLSPYHSPSGAPLVKLAQKCSVKRLRVALSNHHSGGVLYLPFSEEASVLPKSTRFVLPVADDPTRFAHAKCFEIEARDAYLTMCGSVNATEQSLWTTRNVEVSLARKSLESSLQWEDVAKPDEYRPCEFDNLCDEIIPPSLQASWIEGAITGTLSPALHARQVRLEVWNRTALQFLLDGVALDEHGNFKANTTESCSTDTALRLKLIAGKRVATGWLNVERELAAPPHEKDLQRAAGRVCSGRPGANDMRKIYALFLRILKRALHTPIDMAAANIASPPPNNSSPDTPRNKPTNAPSVNSPGASAQSRSGSNTRYDKWNQPDREKLGGSPELMKSCLAAAFVNLAQPSHPKLDGTMRKGPEEADNPGNQGSAAKGVDTTRRKKSGSPKPKRAKTLIGKDPQQAMFEVLPRVLAVDASAPMLSGLVALSAASVLMRAILEPNDATETVENRAVDGLEGNRVEAQKCAIDVNTSTTGALFDGTPVAIWLAQYSRFDYNVHNRERLLSVFCGMAACAAYFAPELSRAALKDDVEKAAGKALDESQWLVNVESALNTSPFRQVPPSAHAAILDCAAAISQSRTSKEQLEELVCAMLGKKEVARGDLSDVYLEVRSVLERIQLRRRTGQITRTPIMGAYGPNEPPVTAASSCAACGTALLHDNVVSNLKLYRAAVHLPGCGKPIFLGLNLRALEASGVAKIDVRLKGY
ncbi:hypothetical protein [Caballeronia sp. LjRoot31]|uniref:hypothetical protein n=1 Tax=Caballeronia sp. LjRoot31 TaxID=3342324 RepID=UPI003ED05660